jgi:hypothetical protein
VRRDDSLIVRDQRHDRNRFRGGNSEVIEAAPISFRALRQLGLGIGPQTFAQGYEILLANYRATFETERLTASSKGGAVSIRPVHFSGDALTRGIETHNIENVSVRIYNPAKTVADCFKARNKIGLDVAIEALRDCWRKKNATGDDLWRYAKICRVSKIMQPYMESIA